MRLTLINQFYVPDISPTAHLAASLAEHRAAAGDQVTVVTSRGGYVPISGDADTSLDSNPRIVRLWTPRLGKATILKRCIDYASFYLLAVWTLLTLPRQDVIISLTTPPFIAWAGFFHKLLHPRTRLVLWNMDCYPDAAERVNAIRPGGIASRLMRAMNRVLFRRLDHLICLDTAMVDLLCGQYAPRDGRLPVSVIPNWEKAAFFPAGAASEPWPAGKELNLTGRFVILYLGNTGTGHHFQTVLDAAEQLKSDPVTFLFVGGGARWKSLQDEVAVRGLGNVLLHGYVPKDQTPMVMGAAACALITLDDSALGVMSPSKMHSNLAMSLPVIYVGPKRSNVDDAIARFGCGVSLRLGDVEGLVDYVRRMIANPAGLAEQRRLAREAFDRAYCDTQTHALFDEVLASWSSAARAVKTPA
jgi:colanic acid biosynthesis glycosyl transferase WcaI